MVPHKYGFGSLLYTELRPVLWLRVVIFHYYLYLLTYDKSKYKKETGLILLGFVLLYWIAVPILPFMDIPHKAWIISGLVVIGEIIFVIAIALLGKEYWGNIKSS